MLDTQPLRDGVSGAFDTVRDGVTDAVFGSIPLLGAGLDSLAGTALGFLDDLEQTVLGAIDSIDSTLSDAAQQLAAALDGLPAVASWIDEVSGNLVVVLGEAGMELASQAIDAAVGGAALGLSLQGEFSVEMDYGFGFGLEVDVTDGSVTYVDASALTAPTGVDLPDIPEEMLALSLTAIADLEASAALGFMSLEVTDNNTGAGSLPAVQLDFAIDIAGTDIAIGDLGLDDLVGTASGQANLDLHILAGLGTGEIAQVLPSVEADFLIDFDVPDVDLFTGDGLEGLTPTIAFNDITFDLGSAGDFLENVFGQLGDITDTFPIGQIIDVLIKPIPVLDDLNRGLASLGLGGFLDNNGDGRVSLRDVVEIANLASGNDLDLSFLDAVIKIAEFIDSAETLGDFGKINIGSFTLLGEAPSSDASASKMMPGVFTLLAGSPPGYLPDLVDDPFEGIDFSNLGILGDLFDDGMIEDGAGGVISVPILGPDMPQIVASLLLNGFDATPLTIVEYDIPALSYEETAEWTFPLLGFLNLGIGGTFGAKIDFAIGYDTSGFAGGDFDFLEGFYVSTGLDEFGEPNPIGELSLGIFGKAIASIAIASVAAGAELKGILGIGLSDGDQDPDDGISHLSGLTFPCLFDEISGRLEAILFAEITIGFGPFSFSERFDIVDAVLARFDFPIPCSGPHGQDPDEVLITNGYNLASTGLITSLFLHMGPSGDLREVGAGKDEDENVEIDEVFAITYRTPTEPDAEPTELIVSAFGINETHAIGLLSNILANGGSGEDAITVAANIDLDLLASGGGGDDILQGGAGEDDLRGDGGNDLLIGGDGRDTLRGGSGNDVLQGGKGPDVINGAGGIDRISFATSEEGVRLEARAGPQWDGVYAFDGFGGDAEGDVVLNVEYIVGSNFSDELRGNKTQSNTLQGLAGDDLLVGGSAGDFLLGGAGGDTLDGGSNSLVDDLEDGTSYLTSFGGIVIDLAGGLATGGDATGDVLIGIEWIQATSKNDIVRGNAVANLIDGSSGNDVLEGRAGQDTLLAGEGSDTVYALGDGDSLDGGIVVDALFEENEERDLLTYRNATGGVFVHLKDGLGRLLSAGVLDPFDVIAYETTFDEFTGETSLLNGVSSFDDLEGSSFADNLTGDDEANLIDGRNGNDTVAGEGGNDTIVGGVGADSIDGGTGIDWLDYGASIVGVTVNLQTGAAAGGHAQGDVIVVANAAVGSTIENVVGTNAVDTLVGSTLDNRFKPLYAGAGVGIDSVDGAGGRDTIELDLTLASAALVLSGTNGTGTATGATRINYTSVENFLVAGSAGNDVVFLVNQGTLVNGQPSDTGDDVIRGGAGNDVLFTGLGRDQVDGGSGDDFVGWGMTNLTTFTGLGGTGIVALDGGSGIDRLSIDLTRTDADISLVMSSPAVENPDQLLLFGDGSSIARFEIVDDIRTGAGDDTIIQPGQVNNIINTGTGTDIVAPGLGVDNVRGGTNRDLLDRDVLILDYSVVNSATGISTNANGGFTHTGIAPNGTNQLNQITYADFEELILTGTDLNDSILGNTGRIGKDTIDARGGNDAVSGRLGDDSIDGGEGNDTLAGDQGSDTLIGGAGGDQLNGGAGNDTLVAGVVGALDRPGGGGADQVTGGTGADLFVLGDATGSFYGETIGGVSDSPVIITDFNGAAGDRIQLAGAPANYDLTTFFGNVAIRQLDADGGPKIIAILTGGATVNLSTEVTYVAVEEASGATSSATLWDAGTAAAYAKTVADLEAAGFGADIIKALNLAADALTDNAVERAVEAFRAGEIDSATLARALSAAMSLLPEEEAGTVEAAATVTGPSGFSITDQTTSQVDFGQIFAAINHLLPAGRPPSVIANGDPVAIGTFEKSPFGLDRGVVISTGAVTQLVGPNVADGGFASPTTTLQTLNLNFEVAGTSANGTVYRADLSGLGYDIASLVLRDSGLGVDGASGPASGFDLDAIFVSNQFLDGLVAGSPQLNDTSIRLDVFDFSPASLQLFAGTQRSGNPAPQANLLGEINGIVDNTIATLGNVDYAGGLSNVPGLGILTFGDGGGVAFDLKNPIDTTGNEPVYLYVVEAGAPETLIQSVTVADQPLVGESDLSTDLGFFGPAGDTTVLDAEFRLDLPDHLSAGVVVDLFHIVIATEELAEYAGAPLEDLFQVKVNGIDALVLNGSDPNGTWEASMSSLQFGPFGAYHPDLVRNGALTGPEALVGPSAEITRADAYTKVLTVRGILVDGENTIQFKVADQRDGLLDTAMFIAPAAPFVLPGVPITGTSGNDSLVGTDAPELIDGLAGRDTLTGGAGNDTLLGGGDADRLNGGLGADSMAGGLGNDTYLVDDAGDIVKETFGAGYDRVFSTVTHTLAANVEELTLTGAGAKNGTGNELANRITGNGAANVIAGGGGADTIAGGNGNDELLGENGNDSLVGGEGNDTLTGGAGDDVLFGEGGDDVIIGGGGLDLLDGGDGDDSLTGSGNAAASFSGGAGDDTITGGAAADRILGGEGLDLLEGGDGNDSVRGGAGNDTVNGGGGADTLVGDGGNDSVNGGLGNDVLFGGGGRDTVIGGAGADTITGGGGNDLLNGGSGADWFLYGAAAFGRDTIAANFSAAADRIDFRGSGLLEDDLVLFETAAGTVIEVDGATDRILIQNVFGILDQADDFLVF